MCGAILVAGGLKEEISMWLTTLAQEAAYVMTQHPLAAAACALGAGVVSWMLTRAPGSA
jgi:hypothetical protein